MRILVTGAAGFIGQMVARYLLEDEDVHHELVLTDVIEPPIPLGHKRSAEPQRKATNLVDDADSLASPDLDAAILLHGIMSSAAEANFELGYKVNVDATRSLLLALSAKKPGIRIIYASSEAVYGNPVPKKNVTETDIPCPELSYGCQKLICETLINDMTRRGKINGFSLRFPTISIRPGKPSSAVTSFLSGIVREPLNGIECSIPLKDRNWRHWMSSPKTLVYNVALALTLPVMSLPLHRRSINVPGFAVTVQDMLDALEVAGGKDVLRLVREEDVPSLHPLLYSWADDFDNSLGLSLGMKQDASFLRSVEDYQATLEEQCRLGV